MTELKYLKGVGEVRAKLLATVGVTSVLDLVEYTPTRYEDRSRVWSIAELRSDMPNVQVVGRFVNVAKQGEGSKARLVAQFVDGTGSLDVVWFKGVDWIRRQICRDNAEWLLYGKPTVYNERLQMSHPEMERHTEGGRACEPLMPIYPLSEALRKSGVTYKTMGEMCRSALSVLTVGGIAETLAADIVTRAQLLPRGQALYQMHCPSDSRQLAEAIRRLKFEELFYVQLSLLRGRNQARHSHEGQRFEQPGALLHTFFHEHLRFPLTGAQKRVVHEIWGDMKSGRQMNRLLEGDVGSGKTLVAFMVMLLVVGNGKQACIMAPTEILALQHYQSLSGDFGSLGVRSALLTGSTPKRERERVMSGLADGSIGVAIGTHALLEENVRFHDLSLCVIDEQHRFGVEQRARLWAKSLQPPHVLVMTATPIPRTLAMTVYGDLDVSVIDEMPPGRKPVTTQMLLNSNRSRRHQLIEEQLRNGHQVYIVFPIIDESDKVSATSIKEGFARVEEEFPGTAIAILYGRQKQGDKAEAMSKFVSGEYRIMVATTVIEVGVNVPNATMMVIENSERYGLSQLHQLRGRVGRGGDQSYCILMASEELQPHQLQRLETMCTCRDGFQIAEADLRLRGPGDLEGTQQSGTPFRLRIANLASDGQLVQYTRDVAEAVLSEDPLLEDPRNVVLVNRLRQLAKSEEDWSRIS